jgi:hypothetical protein
LIPGGLGNLRKISIGSIALTFFFLVLSLPKSTIKTPFLIENEVVGSFLTAPL